MDFRIIANSRTPLPETGQLTTLQLVEEVLEKGWAVGSRLSRHSSPKK